MVKAKNLKVNFAARSVVGFIELAFSLFSFPYVARVLEPTSVGEIDFVNSTIAIFVTLGAFGTAEFGAREVAQRKSNTKDIDNVLSKLLGFRLLLAGILFLFYVLGVVPFYGHGTTLFYCSSLLILTSALNLIWALEAIEDFTFLALAKFFSKAAFLVYLLMFVKTPEDAVYYLVGIIGSDLIYFIAAFLRLKYSFKLSFSAQKLVQIPNRAEILTLIHLFAFVLIQSVIGSIPSIAMGKMHMLFDLGLLSMAFRFFWIGYYAFIPLSTVLLSRSMSFSFDNDSEARRSHLDRTASALFALSIPIAAGIAAISDDIIPILVGDQYLPAIPLLKFLAPLILIFALNNFWSMQVVYSAKRDKVLLGTNLFALACAIILSLVLIPKFKAYGGAAVYLLTFGMLMIASYIYGRKYYKMTAILPEIAKAIIAGLVMYWILYHYNGMGILRLTSKILLGAAIYGLALLVLRHKLMLQLIRLKEK